MSPNNEPLPLIAGHVYEAKTPRLAASGFINDRQIVWVGIEEVQYDGPTVRLGSRYPRVTHEQFREWAGRDITDEMPEEDWRGPELLR
jgi:hypothetical protein